MKLIMAYLLPFMAAYGNSERMDIDIPQVGTDVKVECAGDRIQATVMRSYIERNAKWLGNGDYLSLDVEDRYAETRDCAGTRDSEGNIVLIIKDNFLKCGMQVEKVYETNADGIDVVKEYKFINHVYNQDGDMTAAADRQLDILKFECVYPTVQITTGEMNPLVKSAVSSSKTKEIVGDMRLYKTLNYTSYYTTPPVMNLDEILYVEINLDRPLISEAFVASTDFAVVMEHCWGTPSQNREGAMKYFIIKNQCPVSGDSSLKVESNGEGLQGRFNIKMFKFIGEEYNDIWLHCTVRACNTTAGSCSPDCPEEGAKTRRSADQRQLPFVSFAKDIFADLPIQRKLDGETEFDREIRLVESSKNTSVLEPGSMAFNVLIAIVSIVMLLVFVFGVSCLVVRRQTPLK